MQQIDALHNKNEILKQRLEEFEKQARRQVLTDAEFDRLIQRLASFAAMADRMTVEQKRAAIRSLIKQIVWDGKNAHVILYGSNYKYEFQTYAEPLGENSK